MDDLEPIVQAWFLRNGVYGGYNAETKQQEWDRNKRLEMNRAVAWATAFLAARGKP